MIKPLTAIFSNQNPTLEASLKITIKTQELFKSIFELAINQNISSIDQCNSCQILKIIIKKTYKYIFQQ